MAAGEKSNLYALLGDYPNTRALRNGEVRSDLVDFSFADVKVSNTAFKPLVREAKFDLQAKLRRDLDEAEVLGLFVADRFEGWLDEQLGRKP